MSARAEKDHAQSTAIDLSISFGTKAEFCKVSEHPIQNCTMKLTDTSTS